MLISSFSDAPIIGRYRPFCR